MKGGIRMVYSFIGIIHIEGMRAFIEIPFNVWEEVGLKGNIPCRVSIQECSFECKLIPKGNGRYYIPVNKGSLSVLVLDKEYEIKLEPIDALSRINHNSPYSKEHPVRKIDSIMPVTSRDRLCGQCCVSMLADVPLSEVVELMGKSKASWSKILEALDYYGICYASKAVYTKGNVCQLPVCCIVNNDNRFVLWYKGSFYGVQEIDPKKTKSYIEIFTE